MSASRPAAEARRRLSRFDIPQHEEKREHERRGEGQKADSQWPDWPAATHAWRVIAEWSFNVSQKNHIPIVVALKGATADFKRRHEPPSLRRLEQ
jgi:hypothetical protein